MINLIFVLLACLSLISCSSEEKKLFEQATQLIKLAKETEKISYKKAAKLYNQAQTKIDSISSQFPKSELARKITEGNLEIDIFPIYEFENSILPKAQLKAQAEENPLDCALLFSQKIDSDYLRILTLTELSDAFLKNGNTEKAEKLLPQAFGISEKILESSYKTNALIKIANGFIDQKKFSEAFTVTQKISNFPSQVLLLTQIAIETQDSLLLKKTTEETKTGFNPDEILAQIIQKFSESSNFQKAIETSQKMENPFPKTKILSELAGKLIEKNETELAKTLLLQALEEANKITEKTSQTIVLTKISVNFAEANDFQQALFTAYKISDKTAKSWVLIKIASQFAKQKNYTEAFKTSQKITENNSKVFAFLEIGNAFFENSEPEKAFEVLSFASNTTLKITEPTQKIDFLLEIAKKYFVFGEFEKAKQTLLQALNLAKTLVNFQTQNDQFKKIAVAFAQTKNFTESFQTNDLINENPSFKIEILSEISKVSFAFENKKNASETLDKAFSLISEIEDFETKTKFFENISLDYTEIDEFEKALRIANSIRQEDLKDKILTGIILKLVQTKKFNKALEIVKLLKNESNKTQSLIEIGKLYSKTDANGTKILHELISLN